MFARLNNVVPEFPIKEEDIMAFATIFRNGDTLQNYVSHLYTAHQILGLPHDWNIANLRSLKAGSRKATLRTAKAVLRHKDVQALCQDANNQGHKTDALLYSIAYTYMLPVPSELLPLRIATSKMPGTPKEWHSFLEVAPECNGRPSIAIHLGSRKNAPDLPSRILRACICNHSKDIACGVCALLTLLQNATDDSWTSRPFLEHPAMVTSRLRFRCQFLHIGHHRPIGTHAFRRGRCSDLLGDGTSIGQILIMGGWKSPAVLQYMAIDELSSRVAAIQAVEDSDSD